MCVCVCVCVWRFAEERLQRGLADPEADKQEKVAIERTLKTQRQAEAETKKLMDEATAAKLQAHLKGLDELELDEVRVCVTVTVCESVCAAARVCASVCVPARSGERGGALAHGGRLWPVVP